MPETDPSVTATFEVRVPDRGYWKEQICCQYACPVGTDARGYIRAIAAGDYRRAYLVARGPNPLASMCGRVCGAPCEAACRRGRIPRGRQGPIRRTGWSWKTSFPLMGYSDVEVWISRAIRRGKEILPRKIGTGQETFAVPEKSIEKRRGKNRRRRFHRIAGRRIEYFPPVCR